MYLNMNAKLFYSMYYLALLLLISVVLAMYSLIIYTAVELGGQENYAINVCPGQDAVSRNDCSFVLCAHSESFNSFKFL